ncbi:hypothetical protein RND71_028808 [Anisodus tanguticus]|uniref:Uncharacterized protein n=1 Tax=Anisodus tanguticus TaxID=243964 RepID=A0AAE1VAD6_9SOLA|nr:hypothetical protein RND71_028808 [Anisodus tanguticus]
MSHLTPWTATGQKINDKFDSHFHHFQPRATVIGETATHFQYKVPRFNNNAHISSTLQSQYMLDLTCEGESSGTQRVRMNPFTGIFQIFILTCQGESSGTQSVRMNPFTERLHYPEIILDTTSVTTGVGNKFGMCMKRLWTSVILGNYDINYTKKEDHMLTLLEAVGNLILKLKAFLNVELLSLHFLLATLISELSFCGSSINSFRSDITNGTTICLDKSRAEKDELFAIMLLHNNPLRGETYFCLNFMFVTVRILRGKKILWPSKVARQTLICLVK